MKRLVAMLMGCAAAYPQDVRLHGRVYESGHPEKGIAGVTVALKAQGDAAVIRKLTGEKGVYSFEGAKRGQATVTFTKKGWQPDPRTEPKELKVTDVQLDVDLFLPSAGSIGQAARWKVDFINLESEKDPDLANAAFTSEWRSCEDAAISVRERVTCAKTLNKGVKPSVERPKVIIDWANVDPQKLGYLETNVNGVTLWTKQESDFQALRQTGIPPKVAYAHIMYELDKSTASDAVKQSVELKAKAGLQVSGAPEKVNRFLEATKQ